ncbi:hypothetical protein AB1Y20_013030 [Prymnesium parvum]|uniref:phosphatidate cytidylyltransferase n=1 Tax=Prymnesium parvum TaxID=97485 RepID=A0AB34IM91_PRYPA
MEVRHRKKKQPEAASVSDTETDTEVESVSVTEGGTSTSKPKPTGHSKGESKLAKLVNRLFFGTALLFVLCGVIAAGHLATLGLVVLVQVMMFRELVNVRYSNREFKDLPLYRTTQWLWFGTSLFYSYGSTFFSEKYRHLIKSPTIVQLLPFVELISLALYSGMLILTVLTLKKGYYKYQMGQLAWTISTIVITVVQVKSFTDNIFAGLFWFLFPVSLVICNDSMAYFCGMGCGRKLIRRPFLSISPNKTWEGFLGGAVCTCLFAFAFPRLLVQFDFLICPCEDLSASLFSLKCPAPEVFTMADYRLPSPLALLLRSGNVRLYPIQLHALLLGLFASLVAPFGGFFASGIKRAYKLDDFASIIPGHGGVYDRVDCQLIMGLATSIYYTTFIAEDLDVSASRLYQLAIKMPSEEQLALYMQLADALRAQKLIR